MKKIITNSIINKIGNKKRLYEIGDILVKNIPYIDNERNLVIFLYRNKIFTKVECQQISFYLNVNLNKFLLDDSNIYVPEEILVERFKNLNYEEVFKEFNQLAFSDIILRNEKTLYSPVPNNAPKIRKKSKLILDYISYAFEREDYYICSFGFHSKIVFTKDQLIFNKKEIIIKHDDLCVKNKNYINFVNLSSKSMDNITLPYGRKELNQSVRVYDVLNDLEKLDNLSLCKKYNKLFGCYGNYITDRFDMNKIYYNSIMLRCVSVINNVSFNNMSKIIGIDYPKMLRFINGDPSVMTGSTSILHKMSETFKVYLHKDILINNGIVRTTLKKIKDTKTEGKKNNSLSYLDNNEDLSLFRDNLFNYIDSYSYIDVIKKYKNLYNLDKNYHRFSDKEYYIRRCLKNSYIIREFIVENNLRLSYVSRKAGVSQSTISLYARGNLSQTNTVLLKLVKTFNLKLYIFNA